MASEVQRHKSSRSFRGGLSEEKGSPGEKWGSFQAKGRVLQSYRTEAGGTIARRGSCISYFSPCNLRKEDIFGSQLEYIMVGRSQQQESDAAGQMRAQIRKQRDTNMDALPPSLCSPEDSIWCCLSIGLSHFYPM